MRIGKKKLSRVSQNGILIRDDVEFDKMQSLLQIGHYHLGGIEFAPDVPHEMGFSFKTSEKGTIKDRLLYMGWFLLGVIARVFAFHLRDAAKQYLHYLSGKGTTKVVDYSRAYKEDCIIKSYVNSKVQEMMDFVNEVYCEELGNSFEIIGGLQKIPNGEKENWQKTIGAHYIYGHAKISISSINKASMCVIIYMEDMYNFHLGRKDIASGTSDNINGRFAALGWAKGFKTIGQVCLKEDWFLPN